MDLLAKPSAGLNRDVLLVAIGAFGATAVDVAARLNDQGIGVTVVDPRWVLPVPVALTGLAEQHQLVVTVEDGGRRVLSTALAEGDYAIEGSIFVAGAVVSAVPLSTRSPAPASQ